MTRQGGVGKRESFRPGTDGADLRVVPGGATEAPELDRVIHERLRLGIVSALAVNDALGFNDLKSLLGATDGNLSVHARKLEEAGYLECRKFFAGRQPRTEYRLTAVGRRALERYLDHMERLIRATRTPGGT
jgi:DNA-binding HxlR family transcriptional regulator